MIKHIFILNSSTPSLQDFNANSLALEIISIDKTGMLTSIAKDTLNFFNAPRGFTSLIANHRSSNLPLSTLAIQLLPIFPQAFIYTLSDKNKWNQVTVSKANPYTLQTLSLGFHEEYKIGYEMGKVTAFYSDIKGAFLPPETWATEILKYIKEIRGNPSDPKTYTYHPEKIPEWMIEILVSANK